LDLRARTEGRPLAALLAEAAPAPWVMANAVIGGGPPHEVARFGREALDSGYAVLKVKVGVASVAEDYRRLAGLREACPEAVIRLDANGAWDEATALEAMAAFAPLGIELLEQPVAAHDVEALARVRERAPMRIAADEAAADPATLERVLALRAADIVVLKPMLLGGLAAAAKIAVRAAEHGIGAFVTTTFDSSVGTAAALHLAASLPADAAHGLGTGEHLATDLTPSTLRPTRGRLALPDAPGLGICVDAAALEAAATGPWCDVRDVRHIEG
ncbi:MAG: enolase C-terminal domain-like protein, partial [Dehalococcoidia bacterium]